MKRGGGLHGSTIIDMSGIMGASSILLIVGSHIRYHPAISTIQRRVTRRRAGFSMIELSVVLVVIGLILGAVSIGKDLQRNAEFKKIYGTFVQQWALSYNEYYSRTGLVVGDTIAAGPTLQVNGGAGAVVPPNPGTILCDTNANPSVVGQLHSFMDAVGIEMPPGRAEGYEDRYVYLDSNGNPMEVQICFRNIAWYNSAGVSSNNKNVMVLRGLTPDLARMIDSIVDGRPDARYGSFRDSTVGWGATIATSPGASAVGIVWSATNLAGGLDEAQIPTVVAFYRMNQ